MTNPEITAYYDPQTKRLVVEDGRSEPNYVEADNFADAKFWAESFGITDWQPADDYGRIFSHYSPVYYRGADGEPTDEPFVLCNCDRAECKEIRAKHGR